MTNSFQTWAIKELAKVGIQAEPVANWVTFTSDKTGILTSGTLMSEQGVRDLIGKVKL